MLEPDFWKGRGRYSKQVIARKASKDAPYEPRKASDGVGERLRNSQA